MAGLTDDVLSARLRLFATDASPVPGALHVADSTFNERTLTWQNRPAVGGRLTDLPRAVKNSWIEIDLAGHVLGNGAVLLAVVGSSTDLAAFRSREASVNVPELLITTVAPEAPPSPPLAGFTGSPLTGTAPLSVDFADSSSNNPTSWAWDFDGNGTVDSTAQHPRHSYQEAGTYTVSLTVANDDGSSTHTRAAYVSVTEAAPPPPPPPPPAEGFQPFGTRELAPSFLLDGAGTNIDSIAFWEAPDPADTLMFVTAKGNQLVEVWKYPFVRAEQEPLRHPTFGLDSKVNGVVVDQHTDRLYIAVSRPRSTVAVFSLPDLAHLGDFVDGAFSLGSEPNLALLEDPAGGRLYVSADTRTYVHDATSGALLSQFRPAKGLETMAADQLERVIYIPDENTMTGVYAYDPEGQPVTRGGMSSFGGDRFDSDAEGILIYTCPSDGSADDGRGLIVVADQRADITDFEVFDRQSWAHLGVVRLTGVYNTDGVGSTQIAMPLYRLGLFTAVQSDRRVAGIGWDRVLEATGLSCN